MKRFVLLLSFSVLFFGCNTDSENDLISWIVFNKTDNEVELSLDNTEIFSKNKNNALEANSQNFVPVSMSVSDDPTVKFLNASSFNHLKAVKDYYYLGGSVIRSLTIKPQEKVNFYVSYLGGTEVFATCKILHKVTENGVEKLVDDFITVDVPQYDKDGNPVLDDEGNQVIKQYPKKFTLTVGNAPDGNSSGFDGDKVYSAQKVYEEEQPYYMFYVVANSAVAKHDTSNVEAAKKTDVDFKGFYEKDYIDTSKAINVLAIEAGSKLGDGQYLYEYYGSVRKVETLNSYTEYFMLTAADK